MNTLLILMGAGGGSQQSGGSMVTTFVTIGLMILVFYFLLIRPQKKKEKEAKAMLAAMKKGDKVVTIGGLNGTIAKVKEQTVVLKVDVDTKLEFNKSAISTVLNKSNAEPVKEKTSPFKKKDKNNIKEENKKVEEVETVEAVEVKEDDSTTENKTN